MYAAIRKYQFNPADSDEIARQINEGFLLLVRQTPGFIAYYWVYQGDGVGASFGLFNDQAGADASIRAAADFVKANLAGLLGAPEIVKGDVLATG
jgi:hypothetical protein